MKHKVLIATSGVGSKLGNFTQYTNISLLKIGDKPVISHIIESYPKDIEFVVTLGHFGQLVKDFLELAYPNRSISFVWIDKYEGKGSSLAYSMLKAAPKLQCPFIFHAGDTIVTETIPPPTTNWCGGQKGGSSSQYTSFNVINENIQNLNQKGYLSPDYFVIGINAIHTYKSFWKTAKKLYSKDKYNQSLSDVDIIDYLVKHDTPFKYKIFPSWHDTGSAESLAETKKLFPAKYNVLEKPTESLYFVNGQVIKYFSDKKISSHRVTRAGYLSGIVPKITDSRDNFYKYKLIKGKCLALVAHRVNFKKFLSWSLSKLWQPVDYDKNDFYRICHDFYFDKTKKRVSEFLATRQITDQLCIINGVKVPPLNDLLARIDFDWLCHSTPVTFHGDFILDNVIKTKRSFRLIDWRQDFGGQLIAGDIYYDLAKLNHNLILNHEVINNNHFTIRFKIKPKTNKTIVFCDTLRPQRLVECQEYLYRFIRENNLDLNKIKILTAISWLNMSPLHEHPYDLFLFYFGKYNLLKSINESQKNHS